MWKAFLRFMLMTAIRYAKDHPELLEEAKAALKAAVGKRLKR